MFLTRLCVHSLPLALKLFGDSMNFAARMEANSSPGRIHVSEATANLLVEAGKSRWLRKREDKVTAKGIGEIQTYWIDTSIDRSGSHVTMSVSHDDDDEWNQMVVDPDPEDSGRMDSMKF